SLQTDSRSPLHSLLKYIEALSIPKQGSSEIPQGRTFDTGQNFENGSVHCSRHPSTISTYGRSMIRQTANSPDRTSRIN
ncbi:hypothetical protein GIB67_014209, partial [Kingdonia uniflora]